MPRTIRGMFDANTIGIIFIGVAVGAIVLRLVAIRQPEHRTAVNVATLAMFAILVLVIGLLAWSVVGAYVGGLPD